MRDKRSSILISPTKRREKISRQPSQSKAFELAQEWAKKIKEYGMTDRFGMELVGVGPASWDVYLVDRSIPEAKLNRK
ncbi:hypothetical protein GPA10_22410 [Streptomyces sp. p1417]|uniref:Uncharacterized protein n=1 Tax=Streptomyces typhae TaxID=2681492 RepID=A0A6L6X1B9_9ACTN|nr:hypothetical protein [Streptomyces typhae]MVO87439.1 hypothetical protein [Streptomyces typhae]